jgi:acetyl-CoA decarbonylase/synthase complex subunit gamma
LYAIGEPTAESNVYVSANYKMSFDRLRSALHGRDGWILVLDTKGINVWCAAGKGTFGTDELVRRIEMTRLAEVVSHRQLIVPQLGATGVSAHRVRQRSGFKVVYGPIRAPDLPTFLDAGMEATPEMRRVLFPLRDRVVLIPIELVGSAKYLMAVIVFLLLLSGFGKGAYSLSLVAKIGVMSALLFTMGYVAGAALTPALLPWLPGRAFSTKGAWAGLIMALMALGSSPAGSGLLENRIALISWFLFLPAVSSFLAMNFTGASTYTSLSGVKREMKFAVPLQATGAVLGLVLWIGSRFV